LPSEAATGLVGGREAGPGLVGPAVVVLSVRHLHVVTEADQDLGLSQLLHRGPLAQLRKEKKRIRCLIIIIIIILILLHNS